MKLKIYELVVFLVFCAGLVSIICLAGACSNHYISRGQALIGAVITVAITYPTSRFINKNFIDGEWR